MLGNISSQTAWAIIRLSKPRTLRHEARDEIFQAPSPFFGGGAWVRGYAEIRTKAPPQGPSKSEELIEYLNLKSTVTGGYSEIELEQADSKHALPAKPSRHVNISDPTSEKIQSSAVYQNIDQHPSNRNVQEGDIYNVPDTTNSHTVEIPSEISETVYSKPIQPSLFADAVGTADTEDFQPYGPIYMYTIPINLPKCKEVLLNISGSNIREICEL